VAAPMPVEAPVTTTNSCRWGFEASMTISKFKLTTSSENYQLS